MVKPSAPSSPSAALGWGALKPRWAARTVIPVAAATARTSSPTTYAARGSLLPWLSSRMAGGLVVVTALDVPLIGVFAVAGQRVSDHAGGKGLSALRVDQQEGARAPVPSVRLGCDRLGGA